MLSIFRTDDGTQVCVAHVQYDAAHTLIAAYGCAPIADTAFTLDKKLASATLGPTTVTIGQRDCQKDAGCTVISSRDVAVAATLTGVGAVHTRTARSSYTDGTYTYASRGRAASAKRAALAPWTVTCSAVAGAARRRRSSPSCARTRSGRPTEQQAGGRPPACASVPAPPSIRASSPVALGASLLARPWL